MRLNYAISRLALDDIAGDDYFLLHEPIYVVLSKGGEYWEPQGAYRGVPIVKEGEIPIRGEVTQMVESSFDPLTGEMDDRSSVVIRYGIENYFVPEGEGRALERPDAGRIDILVVIDDRGDAAISQVLVNGAVRYEETLL